MAATDKKPGREKSQIAQTVEIFEAVCMTNMRLQHDREQERFHKNQQAHFKINGDRKEAVLADLVKQSRNTFSDDIYRAALAELPKAIVEFLP